jgi:hypothetical protein
MEKGVLVSRNHSIGYRESGDELRLFLECVSSPCKRCLPMSRVGKRRSNYLEKRGLEH